MVWYVRLRACYGEYTPRARSARGRSRGYWRIRSRCRAFYQPILIPDDGYPRHAAHGPAKRPEHDGRMSSHAAYRPDSDLLPRAADGDGAAALVLLTRHGAPL